MTPFTSLLFTYGTLMDADTLAKVLGKKLTGKRAVLPQYKKKYEGAYPYLEKVTSLAPVSVQGVVYEVTDSDLAKLDKWEVEYDRVKVRLSDGRVAVTFNLKKD